MSERGYARAVKRAREDARWFTRHAGEHFGPAPGGLRPALIGSFGNDPHSEGVCEVLTQLTEQMYFDLGDGCRASVLIAATIFEAVLAAEPERSQLERIGEAVRRLASEAADRVDGLTRLPASVEELQRAATAAAIGSEEIGEAMVEAFRLGGRDGFLTVSIADDPDAPRIRVEQTQGWHFPFGSSPGWPAIDPDLTAYVFVTTGTVTLADVESLQERFSNSWCVCFCSEIEKPAWYTALELHRRTGGVGGHHLIPLPMSRHPVWRELCDDLVALTGTAIVDRLGPAVRSGSPGRHSIARLDISTNGVIVHEIINRPPNYAQQHRGHIERLRKEMHGSDDLSRKEAISVRLARLTGGIIEILVKGESAEQSVILNDLACSTMHATRHFIASGSVPGGGAAYLLCKDTRTRHQSPAERLVAEAVARGLEAPFRRVCERANHDPEQRLQELLRTPGTCFDAVAGRVVDVRQEGPLDSPRVVRAAIRNAGEAVGHMLRRLVEVTERR